MMDNLSSLIPVVGPVIAAAIAGMIAFVVSVLAKENKTSEFRQAWIEGLRSDVAELLGEFNTLEISLGIATHGTNASSEAKLKASKFLQDNRKEYGKVDALCNRVILRLNPTEHAKLIINLRALEGSVGKGGDHSLQLCKQLLEEFSLVLKTEWARVKSGEPVFKKMKYAAFIVTILAVILIIALVITAIRLS